MILSLCRSCSVPLEEMNTFITVVLITVLCFCALVMGLAGLFALHASYKKQKERRAALGKYLVLSVQKAFWEGYHYSSKK